MWGESLVAPLMAATMATAGPEGNRRALLFPRLLLGLSGEMPCVPAESCNQLFNSDLIRLSNSSNVVAPVIFSPLMKKVGVEFTLSTSLANF